MTESTITTTTSTTSAARRRALPFVAGAAFMCVLSAGVGAGAATLVTSAQIKDGTIVSVDVKNGSITSKDLKNGSVTGGDVKDASITGGDVKDQTLSGADVLDGSLEMGDLSAAARGGLMTASIPSGTTVTGSAYWDGASDAAGDWGITIALPGKAHAPLTNGMVNFRTDNSGKYNDDANDCAGSANVPSAPAGQVCVYLVSAGSDSTNIRGAEVYNKPSDSAFAIRWSDSAENSDVYFTAVWAYTAP